MSTKFPDHSFDSQYSGVVAGIDEAGRGPWAGDVVAAAVIFSDKNNIPQGINDSKKLTKAKREGLYGLIMQNACIGVGIANVEEIDQYNILGATKLAMLRAYENLTIKPNILLIDGNQLPNIDCKMEKVVGGDAISPSIAAASIIAKVTRDRMMCKIAEEFPEYGFERNSGYGTALHMQAIAKYGITKYHRKSFAPIKEVILKKAILDEQQRYA